MSISEFFNKKARATIAAGAMLLGTAGGIAGYEAGRTILEPQPSEFTMNNGPQDMSALQFLSGRLPAGFVPDRTAENAAVTAMTQRIDKMAAEKTELTELTGAFNQGSLLPQLPIMGLQSEAARLSGDLNDKAVSFVNDLRADENLSGRDYQALLGDYNKRVGLDVSAQTGNYEKGAAFVQLAQLGADIDNFAAGFGHGGDASDQDHSAQVGAYMQEGLQHQQKMELAGAAGGAVIGGLFMLPLWLKRRKANPQVFKGKTP